MKVAAVRRIKKEIITSGKLEEEINRVLSSETGKNYEVAAMVLDTNGDAVVVFQKDN
jgi:hypothetical protein